jgi:hypothetical protein
VKSSIVEELIRKALLDLESYLNKDQVLLEGMNHTQLISCKRQLTAMLNQIKSGNLPALEKREAGMGRMIADEWPPTQLGEALSKAEQAYKKLPSA